MPQGITASCAKHSSGPSGPCAIQVLCSPKLRDTAQMGSLAGAAHLLQENAGVPKHAQAGRKPLTEEQVKGTADAVTFSKSPQCASVALRSFGQAREFRILKPEVSEKLRQGRLAGGKQAFEATLLFDPSMSALPSLSPAAE